MAEHKKLSMLVKLDDGQTYTLGGDGADNAVTLDTEQTITGLKTFDKLPQSSVEPANDHDLVNKVYVDALKPKLKTTVMLNVESESTSWAAFHSIKFSTTTGKFIEPVYLEDTLTSTAVEPLKFVFKLADSFTGNATAKNKDFFKDYQLQDGEYFGSFTPSHLLEARWSPHAYNEQANPFSNYLAYLKTGPNSVLPFLEYHFDGLSDELKQVEFYIGDIYNSNGYPPEKFQFVVSTGAKEFTSKVYTRAADSIGQGSHHTVEFKLKALEYVTLDTKQEIAGSKTFSENIKVTAKPKEAIDVATVGYVSGLLNAKAPYDVTLDFKVEDDTDGGWVVYSNMEINLDNGKKLKCIHLDNTQPTSANAPVKAVFKAIPATEAINAAPTEQAPTFFDTYQLQDEEYLGTLTYGHILNSQLQDYASYKGPFHTNQYGTTCTIKEATQLRISISELPAAVSKVSLKFDSSYLPKTFKASLSGVGMDVTSNVLTNPSGNTPLELLFDVVKLTGLVTLDTAQTITGAKTFEVLPKSEATPKEDADLITKAYLDERCPIPKSELTLKGSLMQYSYHPDRWIVYQDLRFTLANGQHLVPLYIEDTTVDQIKGPIKVVYKFSDVEYVKNAVVKKTKDFLENYQLKDNELFGQIYHANLLDENAGPHYVNDYVKPFDEIYVGINASDFNLRPLIKFSFEKLSTSLAQVKLSCSGSYAPKQFQLEWEHENKKFVSKLYTFGQDEFLGTAPLEVQIVTAGTGGAAPANMVTTDTAQNITEVKTFDKLPKSSVEPTDDTELVNKKYVDDASKTVVTLADAQTISGVKTFSALPQSSVEPATDTDLVNKKYVDAKVGGGGAAGGNVMTLDTEQTVTAVKQFQKLPRLADHVYILPTDPKEFVNKAYVDTATQNNNGYEVTFHGAVTDAGKYISFGNVVMTLENGDTLVPRYLANDNKPGQVAEAYVLWSYGDTGKTYGYSNDLTEWNIRTYTKNYREVLGRIKLHSATVHNRYNFSPAEMTFTSQNTDEQPLVTFIFEASMPPITKIAFSSFSGDYLGKSFRITTKVSGSNSETSTANQTSPTPSFDYKFDINPAFVPEPSYVNRFQEQDVLGKIHFKEIPVLDKPVDKFGLVKGNTAVAMADLFNSIAVPVPQKQVINIDSRPSKTNIGDRPPYRYQWDYSLKLGDMKLTRKNPSTLADEELFLKFCGPSADGYKGVLTTKKPENYLNPVVEKTDSEMNQYKLEAGECWCKLGYGTRLSGLFTTDEYANQEKEGSNKLKDLFLAKSLWYSRSETEYSWNENGGPKAAVRLYIYDSALVSWETQIETYSYGDTLEVYGDKDFKSYYKNTLTQGNNYPKDVPDVNLQTTNVLGIISALEARIKALEDAAPKP